MKRITVEEVEQAFKVANVKPATGSYVQKLEDGTPCACGLGAIFLATATPKEFEEASDFHLNKYFDEKYGSDYRLGFVHGFDGRKAYNWEYRNKPEYVAGYDDGKAANKKLNPIDKGTI